MISNPAIGARRGPGTAIAVAREMPPTRISVSARSLDADPMRRMAYLAVLCLLFMKVSTINELVHATIGRSLHLLYILGPPAFFGVIVSGGLQRTLRSRTAWLWLAFGVSMAVATPFSYWVGASVKLVFGYFRDDLAMMFLIAGTVVSWKECRNMMRACMMGALVPVLYSVARGGSSRSDQVIQFGTIANANDLAAHLLLFLLFLVFFVLRPQTKMIFRLAAAATAVLQMFLILKTGSRGGLIATGVAILIFVLRAPTRQRIIAILLMPCVVATVLTFLPAEMYNRLFSFSSSAENAVEEALQSTKSREYLLRKSIEFTLDKPVFGVGPGQFSIYEGSVAREAGDRGNWHVTHNAYTQVSSECGIPALLVFLAGIVGTFLTFLRVAKRARAVGHKEIMLAANCLLTGFAAFCVAIIFLSLAYAFYLPAMTGIAIAMYYASEREFEALGLTPAGQRAR
jgi:O-antigen ligase